MRFHLLILIVVTSLTHVVLRGAITAVDLPSPASDSAVGATFTRGPDGRVWLSWVDVAPAAQDVSVAAASNSAAADHGHGRHQEPATTTLRVAVLDPEAHAWGEAREVISGPISTSDADGPAIAVDGTGRLHAVWTDGKGNAFTRSSADQGATWAEPIAWQNVDAPVEMFSLTRLADGRLLAAWLDGRGYKAGGRAQQLRARMHDASGWGDDVLVDSSVCDCCPTTLIPFLDGGALLGYRGRAAEEVRDIMGARYRGGSWQEPRAVGHERWKVNACPVNGPRLASDGSRVAAAWFTAADAAPRVLVSFSPDAGARWLSPVRVDRGSPAGRADVALLRSGSVLVTWVENDGSVWGCRLTPEFAKTEPFALAAPGSTRARGIPRIVLLRDYAGERSSATLLVAIPRTAERGGLQLRLLTVPEGDLLAAELDCDCAPGADELEGFPIRGTIESTEEGAIRVRHVEVPGVLEAGTRTFTVAPAWQAAFPPGAAFLGRIVRRAGHWELVGIRRLGPPAESR